jgi:hypothetical protein
MNERFKSAYEKVLTYRDELNLPEVIDVDFAIDDNGQHHIPIMKIGWMNMPHGTRGRFE